MSIFAPTIISNTKCIFSFRYLCWKKASRALQMVYLSWMVRRCSSCWLKVRPCTRMLGGRISAIHCRELSTGARERGDTSTCSTSDMVKAGGPSSTTRLGIAPLPCSKDTTFSCEQLLGGRTQIWTRLNYEQVFLDHSSLPMTCLTSCPTHWETGCDLQASDRPSQQGCLQQTTQKVTIDSRSNGLQLRLRRIYEMTWDLEIKPLRLACWSRSKIGCFPLAFHGWMWETCESERICGGSKHSSTTCVASDSVCGLTLCLLASLFLLLLAHTASFRHPTFQCDSELTKLSWLYHSHNLLG